MNKHPNLDKIKKLNSPLYDPDYCSLCGNFKSKMINHKFAHKLIVRGELVLARRFY